MPETNTNIQPDNKDKGLSEFSTPLSALLLRVRRPMIVLAHIIAFASSLMLSFLVVHNMQFKGEGDWLELYPALLMFFLIIKLPIFGLFKQYRGWWRYVGISDPKIVNCKSSMLQPVFDGVGNDLYVFCEDVHDVIFFCKKILEGPVRK